MTMLLTGFKTVADTPGMYAASPSTADSNAPIPTPASVSVLAARPKPANVSGEVLGLWEKAANDSSEAAYDLGLAFMTGTRGAPQNNAEADFWLKQAVADNFAQAMGALGNVYAKGLLGHPVNLATARLWYLRGSHREDPASYLPLGEMMLKGEGGKPDEDEAFNAFMWAGTIGSGPGALELARLYEKGGDAVPKSLRLAYLWSGLAESFGLEDAAEKAENAARQKSLKAVLSPENAAWLDKRRDDLVEQEHKFKMPLIDDGPEESISLPDGGVSWPTPPDTKLIRVAIDFDGQGPRKFIIDTGCCSSIINEALAKKLGLKEVGRTAVSDLSLPIVSANGTIAGVPFHNLRLVAIPWSPALGRMGISGTLGGDFIRLVRLKCDYKHHTATLLPPGPDRGGGIPLDFEASIPMLQATIEGIDHQSFTASAIVDTGNHDAIVMSEALNREHPFQKIASFVKVASAGGVDGMSVIKVGAIASLSIGGFHIDKPELAFEPGLNGANWAPLNIGSDVLNQFVIEFDYAHARLYLTPNNEAPTVTQPQPKPKAAP